MTPPSLSRQCKAKTFEVSLKESTPNQNSSGASNDVTLSNRSSNLVDHGPDVRQSNTANQRKIGFRRVVLMGTPAKGLNVSSVLIKKSLYTSMWSMQSP